MTDAEILAIRDEHLPSQGEAFDCLAFARALLGRVPPREAPREPTDHMVSMARHVCPGAISPDQAKIVWRAMLDAAPSAQPEGNNESRREPHNQEQRDDNESDGGRARRLAGEGDEDHLRLDGRDGAIGRSSEAQHDARLLRPQQHANRGGGNAARVVEAEGVASSTPTAAPQDGLERELRAECYCDSERQFRCVPCAAADRIVAQAARIAELERERDFLRHKCEVAKGLIASADKAAERAEAALAAREPEQSGCTGNNVPTSSPSTPALGDAEFDMGDFLGDLSEKAYDDIRAALEAHPGCGFLGMICMVAQRAYDEGFKRAGGEIVRITLPSGQPANDYRAGAASQTRAEPIAWWWYHPEGYATPHLTFDKSWRPNNERWVRKPLFDHAAPPTPDAQTVEVIPPHYSKEAGWHYDVLIGKDRCVEVPCPAPDAQEAREATRAPTIKMPCIYRHGCHAPAKCQARGHCTGPLGDAAIAGSGE